jgi:hypothetical protein
MARTKGISRKSHTERNIDHTDRIRRGLETKRKKKEKKEMSKRSRQDKRQSQTNSDDEGGIDTPQGEAMKKRRADGLDAEVLENTPVEDFEILCDDAKYVEADTEVDINPHQWTLRCKLNDGVLKVEHFLT